MKLPVLNSIERELERLNHIIVKISSFIIITFMGSMVLILGAQVFTRYVFNWSIFWNEEFARYSLLWIIFLALGIAYEEGQHINITNFVDALPKKTRLLVILLSELVLIFFLYYMIKYGFSLTAKTFVRGHISPALRIPMWVAYLSIPVGGVAMLFQVIQKSIKLVKELI